MKKINYIIVLTPFLICLQSCDKNDSDIAKNKSVEQFIKSLKLGEYESSFLPDFTYKDIPALLQYRNEKFIIAKFPKNPISSLAMPECNLGMFVLWTIESIRVVSIDSTNLVMNFPSQNPILGLRLSDELQIVMDELSHNIAAKAYYDWWENNKMKEFDEFNIIDPLHETDYRWK